MDRREAMSRRVRSTGRPAVSQRPGVVPPAWRPRGERRGKRRRQIGIVVLVAFVAWIFWYFRVNQIRVTGNHNLTTVTIQADVQKLQHSHRMWGNMLTVDTEGLQSALLASEHQLKSATVRRVWPHTLAIDIIERQPALAWNTFSGSFILDSEGVIVASNPAGSPLVAVTDNSNIPYKVGDQVVSARFVEFARAAPAGLSDGTGITITGMSVGDTTAEITAKTNKGYALKLDTTRPIEDTAASLKQVLAELAAQKKAPAEYIDLRIEQKAYYK
jgi:cell division septal protein FtsQ